jgi:hypothetical protein
MYRLPGYEEKTMTIAKELKRIGRMEGLEKGLERVVSKRKQYAITIPGLFVSEERK